MGIRRSLLSAAGAACALLPLTAAAAAPDPGPAPEPVVPDAVFPLVAYTEHDLGGASQAFGSGVFDADSGGLGAVGADAISSLRVAEGYRVLACDLTPAQAAGALDGLGACRYYDAGWYDRVGGGLDESISLLAVVATAEQRGTGVTVYGGAGFTGGRLALGPGRHEADSGDLARLDAVNSLTVDEGHTAVLCDSFRSTAVASGNPGICQAFGPGEHDTVGAGLADVVSLVAVGGPAVTATQGYAMAGAAQTFAPGIHQAGAGELAIVGNDAISSLRVAPGYRVLACADDGAGADSLDECTLFEAGTHDLAGTGLDEAVSLLAVSAGPASGDLLTAYDGEDLAGTSGGFGPGIYAAADLGAVGNDEISSLRLADGARAVLCEHDDTEPGEVGTCRLFTGGEHGDLGELDDRTSLLAVS
ncbi:hypothetical protein [Catellatospora bangladeshensis]|uniref:Uncharacterized protein n=1 Tax=Catellatospora bangladeshensis TaxID=310355 RepID=A0A8J3JWH8_9ACTN|nr:hypothetical protein [Catellatospora bangladeshensis]GIF86415.1 hypothetical protein Cba03nite_77640 [Catellatospora bangladeshensis]